MAGFNIPPFLMSLTLLAGAGVALVLCLGVVLWSLLPLPVAVVLTVPFGHVLLTGVVVALAASKPLHGRTTGLFGKASTPWTHAQGDCSAGLRRPCPLPPPQLLASPHRSTCSHPPIQAPLPAPLPL